MAFSIQFQKKATKKANTIVVGVFDKLKLTSAAQELNDQYDGIIKDLSLIHI